MNAKELRIGNWLHHGKYWSYRNGNESKEFDFQWNESDWYALGECTLSLENIEPIPLTKEWLLKLGFDNRYESHWKSTYSDGFGAWDFILQKPTEERNYYWYEFAKIEYLHQLQNLYFALTGEELIIK